MNKLTSRLLSRGKNTVSQTRDSRYRADIFNHFKEVNDLQLHSTITRGGCQDFASLSDELALIYNRNKSLVQIFSIK